MGHAFRMLKLISTYLACVGSAAKSVTTNRIASAVAHEARSRLVLKGTVSHSERAWGHSFTMVQRSRRTCRQSPDQRRTRKHREWRRTFAMPNRHVEDRHVPLLRACNDRSRHTAVTHVHTITFPYLLHPRVHADETCFKVLQYAIVVRHVSCIAGGPYHRLRGKMDNIGRNGRVDTHHR